MKDMGTIENVMEINGKISNLSKEEQERFYHNFIESLFDRNWCMQKGINYFNPDFTKVKTILYDLLYKS